MSEQAVAPQPQGAGREIAPRPAASMLPSGAAIAAALVAALWIAGVHPAAAAFALALYAAICSVAAARLDAYHPFSRFGPANIVTLVRAGLTCLVAAMVFDEAPSEGWWLAVFLIAGAALALDGIDGWASRRTGLASAFGARFDMEVDALLAFILSASAFIHGKAGAWVLLLGLLRYLFLAAALVFPALRDPLPFSLRRKVVCVLQIGILCLLLLPAMAPPLSGLLALVALAALAWSFAADMRWLLAARARA